MSIRQFSTIDALMLGHFQGCVSVADILKVGNLGLGAMENLAGECLIIDGKCYIGQPGGSVVPADAKDRLAFATVADFSMAGTLFQAHDATGMAEVKARADEVRIAECGNDGAPCICRIDGKFSHVRVRSFHEVKPPFKPLLEIASEQVEASADNIEGTLIGFWFPRFVSGLNQEGWHFHFIARDRHSFGGHCLDCSLASGLIGCRRELSFSVTLPEDESFGQLPLGADLSARRQAIENESQREED